MSINTQQQTEKMKQIQSKCNECGELCTFKELQFYNEETISYNSRKYCQLCVAEFFKKKTLKKK
jgi:formylmethanofuran dehydrogenase subunit E